MKSKESERRLAERIRIFRKKQGLSMEELGNMLGVSRQTVFRYENATITNIPRDKIQRMAEIFDTTEAVLMGFTAEELGYEGILPLADRAVPMLGEIACGSPIYADEERGAPRYAGVGGEVSFCLRAKGDSMTGAHIHDGDIVFVHAQESVDNGEIGVVIIGDEATLKRVYYYPESEKLVLMPENAAYEPMVFVGHELDGIKVIGKAVAFQSVLK